MNRRPLLVANWKMYKTVAESTAFAHDLVRRLEEAGAAHREVVICPTYPAIWPVARVLDAVGIQVGAQSLDLGTEGAFTGAVSGHLLAEAGATFVIVGHSERRQWFGEDDAVVASKVKAALEHQLSPILCVGESAEERAAGQTESVLRRQLAAVFPKVPVEAWPGMVLAYEPIWAIGTGHPPEPAEANRVAALLRRWVVEQVGEEGRLVRVLYGGSVNPDNVAGFWSQAEVDGALVGGASLDVAGFFRMMFVEMEGK